MPGDAELLSAYADSGDEAAFAELVRRHVDGVYSSALRRLGGDVHLAEDVVQRVFVILARKASHLVHHPALTAWLYLTVRNETAQIVRSERRRKAREQEAVVMHETSASEKETDWTHVAPVLDEALDALGERDRTAILLRFVHHQAFAEMGRALQLSEDAARMRVERALEKLQRWLMRRGITSSAVALGVALADHAVTAAPAGLAATATGQALSAVAASTVTVPLSSGLIFMSLSKLTSMIVGGALAIAVIGIALHERSKRLDAEATLGVARREDATLQSELFDLQRREAEANRAVEDLRTKLAGLRAQSVEEKKAVAPWNGLQEGAAFLARHSEVTKALIESNDANTRSRFGALFSSLHLTADEVARFLEIMRSDSIHSFSIGPNGQFLMLRLGEELSFEDRNAQLRALLGEDRFKDYQVFSRGTVTRSIVEQVGRELAFSEAPLSPDQVAPLLDLISSHRFTPAGVNMRATDWPAVMAAAQNFMSGPQLTALDQMGARETAQIEQRRKSASASISPRP